MAQQTYLTPEALQFSLRQSAMLISHRCPMRIAAFAQPTAYKGSWNAVRFDWSEEHDRVDSFVPDRHTGSSVHWAS